MQHTSRRAHPIGARSVRRTSIACRSRAVPKHYGSAGVRQREQAARSEIESALKTRDDFLAAASHELRNPLNALMLQLGGLRRAAQRDPSSLATPAMTGRWDQLRVEQVVSNLLSNAFRYGDGKPVGVEISLDGDCAHIDVTDGGIGIPSDMVQRLFARFERLTPDHRRGGFGLGLWTDFRAEQKRDDDLRGIPVIAISAAGKLMDADHTLRKPINIETLLNLLRTVLAPAAN